MTSTLNVVFLDGDITYPMTSGKRLRTLHLMKRMARRHRVTYLVRGDAHGEQAKVATEHLAGLGITMQVIHAPVAPKAGLRFHGRLALNLLSPLPYSVASYLCEPMRYAAREHAARERVDLWQLEFSPFLDSLRDLDNPRTVINAPNVETLIWQRYAEVEKNPLKKWFIRGQRRKYERFERATFARAGRVAVCTEADAAIVRGWGLGNVEVVENGIDGVAFADLKECRRPGQLLFLGSLDWRPNLDALRLLLDWIFPRVQQEEPDARLDIVGRHPPAWVRERAAATPGVAVHADVPDIRPYLAQSGVMVVPLRVGGGSRLKILEALAAGLPVVSTRVGSEGLGLTPGEHLVEVERVEQMAPEIVRCIRQPLAAQGQARAGQRTVLARYDWDILADKLERIWEQCLRA